MGVAVFRRRGVDRHAANQVARRRRLGALAVRAVCVMVRHGRYMALPVTGRSRRRIADWRRTKNQHGKEKRRLGGRRYGKTRSETFFLFGELTACLIHAVISGCYPSPAIVRHLRNGTFQEDINISWRLRLCLTAALRSKKRERQSAQLSLPCPGNAPHRTAIPNIFAAVPHRICCFSAALRSASCTTLSGMGSPIGKG